jgi:hypothetical protein
MRAQEDTHHVQLAASMSDRLSFIATTTVCHLLIGAYRR